MKKTENHADSNHKFRWEKLGQSCWAAEERTENRGLTRKIAAAGKGFFSNVLAVDEIRENGQYIRELSQRALPRGGGRIVPPHPAGGAAAFREACQKHGADREHLQKLEKTFLRAHRVFWSLSIICVYFSFLGVYLLHRDGWDLVNFQVFSINFSLIFLFAVMNMKASIRLWQIRNRQMCGFVEFFSEYGWRRLLFPI